MHGTIDCFQWTEARIADLKSKIDAGLSASETAGEMGISRNAAIGKAHRLGLTFNSPDIRNFKYRASVPKREPYIKPKPRPALRFDCTPAEVVPLHIPFLDRDKNQCAQLYGDDPATMTWCGHPCFGSLPYCESHALINYQPSRTRGTK
jgi:GcrA cell cycle regulator